MSMAETDIELQFRVFLSRDFAPNSCEARAEWLKGSYATNNYSRVVLQVRSQHSDGKKTIFREKRL